MPATPVCGGGAATAAGGDASAAAAAASPAGAPARSALGNLARLLAGWWSPSPPWTGDGVSHFRFLLAKTSVESQQHRNGRQAFSPQKRCLSHLPSAARPSSADERREFSHGDPWGSAALPLRSSARKGGVLAAKAGGNT